MNLSKHWFSFISHSLGILLCLFLASSTLAADKNKAFKQNLKRIDGLQKVTPKNKRSPSSRRLRLRQGDQRSFLLRGTQYHRIDSVLVHPEGSGPTVQRPPSRVLNGKHQTASRTSGRNKTPNTSFTAQISHITPQGRWVEFAVPKNAKPGIYWFEGLVRSRSKNKKQQPIGMLESRPLPLAIQIVTQTGRSNSALQKPGALNMRRLQRNADYALSSPMIAVRNVGASLQRYEPACDLLMDALRAALQQGHEIPCSSHIQEAASNNQTYLLSHQPTSPAQIGTTLEILGSNMPTNLSVYQAGRPLQINSNTDKKIVASLPATEGTGDLSVVQSNGEVLGLLNSSYQVRNPPTIDAPIPQLFENYSGSATTINWRNAYEFSMLSWLSYFDDLPGYLSTNPEFSEQLDLTVLRTFDKTHYSPLCHLASGSMQGVVLEHDESDSVIIAIRGSQSSNWAQDWIDNDLDSRIFSRLGWALGNQVHCGFHQAAKVVFDELHSEIETWAEQGKKLFITGHSLGGAAAMMLASMLEWDSNNNIQVAGVYAYGSPGIGNFKFRDAYDQDIPNTHRFEIQRDPAVSLGLPILDQPGKSHLLHTDGSTTLNHGTGYLGYYWYKPISDLGGAHMNYWCRIFAEFDQATSGNQLAEFPLPPLDPGSGGVCDVTDF